MTELEVINAINSKQNFEIGDMKGVRDEDNAIYTVTLAGIVIDWYDL